MLKGVLGWMLVIVAMLWIASILTDQVRAEDRPAWFKSLKLPDGASCCDIADCKQTQAKYKDGWWAIVRGVVRKIPDETILRKPRSIDGEAYVCASESGLPERATIYCFIEPTLGY